MVSVSCLDHLHYYAWWTCSFVQLHLWDGLLHHVNSGLLVIVCWTCDLGPTQTWCWEALHHNLLTHSALPPRSFTFSQHHSSLAFLPTTSTFSFLPSCWRGGKYQTLLVSALIDHLFCFMACIVHPVWRCASNVIMMPAAWLWWHLLLPYSTTNFHKVLWIQKFSRGFYFCDENKTLAKWPNHSVAYCRR